MGCILDRSAGPGSAKNVGWILRLYCLIALPPPKNRKVSCKNSRLCWCEWTRIVMLDLALKILVFLSFFSFFFFLSTLSFCDRMMSIRGRDSRCLTLPRTTTNLQPHYGLTPLFQPGLRDELTMVRSLLSNYIRRRDSGSGSDATPFFCMDER